MLRSSCSGWLLLLTLAPAVPAQTVPVKLDFADGRHQEAKVPDLVLKLETDYGSAEVKLARVRTIHFQQVADRAQANIVLQDKSRLSGRVVRFDLIVDGQPIAAEQLR